jgi:hypothetical protein
MTAVVSPAKPKATIEESSQGLGIVIPARRNWFITLFLGASPSTAIRSTSGQVFSSGASAVACLRARCSSSPGAGRSQQEGRWRRREQALRRGARLRALAAGVLEVPREEVRASLAKATARLLAQMGRASLSSALLRWRVRHRMARIGWNVRRDPDGGTLRARAHVAGRCERMRGRVRAALPGCCPSPGSESRLLGKAMNRPSSASSRATAATPGYPRRS